MPLFFVEKTFFRYYTIHMESTSATAFSPHYPGMAPDGSLMALADCDSFYASCERVARPDLLGKPVIVLSNNDGCVVARSKEAKALGIPMGEPEFQIRDFLKKHDVAVFSSNYTLYGDLSHRVMQTLATVTPKVEVYSIDEAFLPLKGSLAANADAVAKCARERVGKWIGLPLSIGIGPTRVLAKIATKLAKKYPAYQGICNLQHCRHIDEALASIDVGDIWGIGRRGALKLKANGIRTALDLRDSDANFIRKLLTITGFNILMELRGIPAIGEDIPLTHSTVISSCSLGYKVSDISILLESAAFHAARAAEKLRARSLLTQMVGGRIQTSWAAKDQPQHDEMAFVRLPSRTFDTAPIITAARKAVAKIFRTGYAYAKVMVMLTDISDPVGTPGNLLDIVHNVSETTEKRRTLMEMMDRLNRIEGRGTLRFASQGTPTASWHMNRNRLSPAWSTNIHELLTVG